MISYQHAVHAPQRSYATPVESSSSICQNQASERKALLLSGIWFIPTGGTPGNS